MKVKLFVALEIQYFELRIFSFNSYVYYVTVVLLRQLVLLISQLVLLIPQLVLFWRCKQTKFPYFKKCTPKAHPCPRCLEQILTGLFSYPSCQAFLCHHQYTIPWVHYHLLQKNQQFFWEVFTTISQRFRLEL